jgi:hypothetical protein
MRHVMHLESARAQASAWANANCEFSTSEI